MLNLRLWLNFGRLLWLFDRFFFNFFLLLNLFSICMSFLFNIFMLFLRLLFNHWVFDLFLNFNLWFMFSYFWSLNLFRFDLTVLF